MKQPQIVVFLAAVSVIAIIAEPSVAQTQFAKYGKQQFPHLDVEGPPHLADVDRDGDLDVIFVGTKQVRLFLNNGEAVFSEATQTHMPNVRFNGKRHPAISGDIDGDGDLDLFFADEGQNRLYINDGKGHFSDATQKQLPRISDLSQAARFVDIDGDKDLDLIIANGHSFAGRQSRIYRNNGKGFFSDVTSTQAPKISDKSLAVVVGDFDGNGAPDAFFIDKFPAKGRHLWLNDGKGKFTDATAQLPSIVFPSNGVDAADIDSDGDLDLVFSFPNTRFRFFRNMGKAKFVDDTESVMPTGAVYSNQIKLADMDNDGDIDLLATSWRGPAILYLYFNGKFRDLSSILQPNWEGAGDLAVGDLDGDRDADFILNGHHKRARVYLGVGPARSWATLQFQNAAREFHGVSTVLDGYADFDEDGDIDILTREGQLRLGDGTGRFTIAPKGSVPAIPEKVTVTAVGDVNGDGHLDVWIGTSRHQFPPPYIAGQDRIFLGDGKGHFSDVTFLSYPKTDTNASWGELVDLDRDGDLDLVYTDSTPRTGQLKVLLNDGRGKFSPATLKLPTMANIYPTMADVDGDGDLDMALSNGQLWLNDGKGNFKDVTATHYPSRPVGNKAALAGDIDGDGDLDLFFPGGRWSKSLLYLNRGKGVYTDVSPRLGSIRSWALSAHLADIDEDGDLDILLVDMPLRLGQTTTHHVLINDGKGQFRDDAKRRIESQGFFTASGRLIDIDQDGDLDYISSERLLLNRHRQVSAPWLARLGANWALDYYSEAGVAENPALALPWFGTKKARLAIPGLGFFGIDPQNMVQGPVVSIPAKTGWARVTMRIPQDGALTGKTLYIQALIISRFQTPPGIWKLTNVLIEPIYK